MNHQYIVQPWESDQYASLFRIAMERGCYTKFYAAVAYATWGGVLLLDRLFRDGLGLRWNDLHKQWLVGIDWCRTDPSALTRLAALTNSTVKVPSGEFLVCRKGCRAVTPYHPKLFVLLADRTLKFGDNDMDKLNVPSAGERGHQFYRDKTLLFTRQSGATYQFHVGDNNQAGVWKQRSLAVGQHYKMPRGREWGLF